MNIFFLHQDPAIAARYHCDEHVTKMIVETAQMASTIYRQAMGEDLGDPVFEVKYTDTGRVRLRQKNRFMRVEGDVLRKKLNTYILDSRFVYLDTHPNHPCTKWAKESKSNYTWLVRLGLALCDQFEIRNKKVHKTKSLLLYLKSRIPVMFSPDPEARTPLQQYLSNGLFSPPALAMDPKFHVVVEGSGGPPPGWTPHRREIHANGTYTNWCDVVASYRYFYLMDKSSFATWNRGVLEPYWYIIGRYKITSGEWPDEILRLWLLKGAPMDTEGFEQDVETLRRIEDIRKAQEKAVDMLEKEAV